jgi:hypothetical protein
VAQFFDYFCLPAALAEQEFPGNHQGVFMSIYPLFAPTSQMLYVPKYLTSGPLN